MRQYGLDQHANPELLERIEDIMDEEEYGDTGSMGVILWLVMAFAMFVVLAAIYWILK